VKEDGKERKTERQKDRKTERQKDRKTERQKDRKTERQKDRKTERQMDDDGLTASSIDKDRERNGEEKDRQGGKELDL
jgi:hypothetical protein